MTPCSFITDAGRRNGQDCPLPTVAGGRVLPEQALADLVALDSETPEDLERLRILLATPAAGIAAEQEASATGR